VGWTFNEDICFSLEAVDYNCGSLIQLAKSIGKKCILGNLNIICGKITLFFIFVLGGFNNPKELNMLKQGNEFSTDSLLFVLPESEVVT